MINPCYGFSTHIGYVRNLNEDNYCCDIEHGLWVVADGVGGYKAGDIASRIAVESIEKNVRMGVDIYQAVEKAHQEILDAPNYGIGSAGMGTTVAAVKVDKDACEVVWVGDSRVYILSEDGLSRLTMDHSYAQELLTKGEITADEVSTHPSKNILTRCLGMKGNNYVIRPGHLHSKLLEGDRLLLCTDGVYGELSDQEIFALLSVTKNDQDAADILISKALEKGGADNITAIVLSVDGRC